ncbi:hypothetical protein [Marinobacter psychrophilus]|jgi:hypothetical protein|uniref:hypothetical protein n=1 Tax=Marinobacter psychrophilus TaxID=330734 RepID=UPI001B3D5BC4|nr:hypothetical protein [Marinobacter psychrophilus]MBQ0762087.1 hypothetical protein [Marinobacter psychrophilus]MBQ0843661.1 hypothetical protein [Marinobacter psychrophilus]
MRLDYILDRIDFGILKPTERTRYINRINNIAGVIEERFPHVKHPEQIKLKNAEYFRNVWLPAHSSSTRTQGEHMRALGLLVRALGRDDSWLGKLGLTSHSSTGGRPTQIKIRKSRKH